MAVPLTDRPSAALEPPRAPAAAPADLAVPERYALRRELGRGGMGVVWLADDRRLGRLVAIKILPRALADDAALHERFVREARLAASLAHPNVVPVHEVEEHAGQLLFVMGYVDGETLGARVARGGPLPLGEALRALRDVAWALAYAHERGVVHRDVKPDNVLVERGTGRALLVDFGIARAHHPGAARGAASGVALTRVGEVVGTPHFMSPEQATGDQVDARSDIYSLGVAAFTVLSGQVPFDGATTTAIIAKQLTAPPPDLGALRPDLPPALVQVVERCLAKDPDARFPDAHALADALDALAAARPQVAPAIRAAETTTGQTLVFVVAVLALAPLLVRDAIGGDKLLAMFFAAILVAMAPLRLVGIARGLTGQGLPLDATRAGFRALAAERLEAAQALRAAGGGARPGRRRVRLLALGLFTLVVVRATQEFAGLSPWISLGRLVVAFVGVALIAVAVVQHLLRADRVASAGRLVRWLWVSPLGAACFALGGLGRRGGDGGAVPARAAAPERAAPVAAPLAAAEAREEQAVQQARPDARDELREALALVEQLRDTLRRAVDGPRDGR